MKHDYFSVYGDRYIVLIDGKMYTFDYYVDALVFAAKAGHGAVLYDTAYNLEKHF